uniref:Putative cyclin b n=1 Tax=Corethrella appendiculata TaxID=1370023 RepID=U5EVM6_9DIPT
MATERIRIQKIDENETIATGKLQLTKNQIKKDAIVGKRMALGDVGNRVLKNDNDAATKNKENSGKTTLGTFKHIKPRVDTHWRKDQPQQQPQQNLLTKPVTRSDSLKSTTNSFAAAKRASVAVKQTTLPVQTKLKEKTAVTKPVGKPIVKREESQLSRRSLSKIRAAKSKGSTSSLSSNASSTSSKNGSQENIVKLVAAAANAITAKVQKISSSTIESHSSKMIENIDQNDYENPLLVSEYVNDIYAYLNQMESIYGIRENYLYKQKEITSKMRAILIDWINEVHLQFKLEIETYYMAVSLIDRYLQVVDDTAKKQLQLVGVTALFIASKYEELYPPEIQDFVFITDDTYNKKQILKMEMNLVRALDFQIAKPLPIHFLRRFSKASKAEDINHTLAKYLIELASVDYGMVHYKPSEIAAAALFISLTLFPLPNSTTLTKSANNVWTSTIEFYTTYKFEHIKPIVNKLATICRNAPQQKLQAIYAKYSSSKFESIAKCEELYGFKMEQLLLKTTTL